LAIECATDKFEIAQRARTIEQLCREEVAKRVELYTLQENLHQTYGAYLSALTEGQRLIEERYNFRVKTAAQVQEYRYQDMAFRIFKNDALQKYRAQFDLAARYVYLAAKAYDYETCLLNAETGAGSRLLTDIVRQRTLGQLVNGLPVSGRQGLADPLARLGQNFEVYRGSLASRRRKPRPAVFRCAVNCSACVPETCRPTSLQALSARTATGTRFCKSAVCPTCGRFRSSAVFVGHLRRSPRVHNPGWSSAYPRPLRLV